MLLIDTSVWIDVFSKKPRWKPSAEDLISVVTCPPVIQEVLQGVKQEAIYLVLKESLLNLNRVADPVTLDDHLAAADLYRSARRKGYTVRSATDCLIAAIAIRERLTVFHYDRDFDAIARFSQLSVKRSV